MDNNPYILRHRYPDSFNNNMGLYNLHYDNRSPYGHQNTTLAQQQHAYEEQYANYDNRIQLPHQYSNYSASYHQYPPYYYTGMDGYTGHPLIQLPFICFTPAPLSNQMSYGDCWSHHRNSYPQMPIYPPLSPLKLVQPNYHYSHKKNSRNARRNFHRNEDRRNNENNEIKEVEEYFDKRNKLDEDEKLREIETSLTSSYDNLLMLGKGLDILNGAMLWKNRYNKYLNEINNLIIENDPEAINIGMKNAYNKCIEEANEYTKLTNMIAKCKNKDISLERISNIIEKQRSCKERLDDLNNNYKKKVSDAEKAKLFIDNKIGEYAKELAVIFIDETQRYIRRFQRRNQELSSLVQCINMLCKTKLAEPSEELDKQELKKLEKRLRTINSYQLSRY